LPAEALVDDFSALFASPFPNRQEEALARAMAQAQALRNRRPDGATAPPLVSLEDDGPARTLAQAEALRARGGPSASPAGTPPSSDALDAQRAMAAALRGGGQQGLNAYELFAPDEAAPPQAGDYASSVRNQRGAGMLGLITGDSVLSRIGEAQLRGAGQHEAMLAEAGQHHSGNVLKKALAVEKAKQDAKDYDLSKLRHEETKRHNHVMEARPVPTVYLQGSGGQYFGVNPGGGPAVPIVDSSGAPVIKPEPIKQLSAEEKNALQSLTTEAQSIATLAGKFKDEYAGDGAVGNAKTAVASAAGSWAPEKEQEIAAFWADFASLIDLPQRNKIFGASLSEGEKAAWESAKNIKRGSNPERVRQKFVELAAIANSKLEARRAALLAEGYPAESINALTASGGTTRTTPSAAMPVDGSGNFSLTTPQGGAPPSPAPHASPQAQPGGAPSRPDKGLDPAKKETSRTYSTDGQWMRVLYEDGTFGLGPSDRKQ
jgi:hypothetical protein